VRATRKNLSRKQRYFMADAMAGVKDTKDSADRNLLPDFEKSGRWFLSWLDQPQNSLEGLNLPADMIHEFCFGELPDFPIWLLKPKLLIYLALRTPLGLDPSQNGHERSLWRILTHPPPSSNTHAGLSKIPHESELLPTGIRIRVFTLTPARELQCNGSLRNRLFTT
jgi:hypothetical protein